MFDINRPILDPKYGEFDEQLMYRYIEGISEEFAKAQEAQLYREKFGWDSRLHIFLEYVFGHIGTSLPELTTIDANEILFDIFPRKVSTRPESAAGIVAELRAFFAFLDRQYRLPNAKQLLEMMTEQTEQRLRAKLADPANYGMAKSFVMLGTEAGYDMTTQEGNNAFMLEYNRRLANVSSSRNPMPLAGQGILSRLDDEFSRDESIVVPLSPEKLRLQRENRRKARKTERKARKKNRK